MKIAFFAFSHMEYVIELANGISKYEKIMLMIPDKHSKVFRDVIDKRVNLKDFYQPRLRSPSNLYTIYKLIKVLYKYKPDIIHLQGEHPWFDLFLPLIKRIAPVVVTVHDVILHSGDLESSVIPKFIYDLNRKFADKIIVHGKLLKQEMLENYQRKAEDIYIFPRGINSIYNNYVRKNVVEEENTLLFFGRIWEYKGLKYLIHAAPLIEKEISKYKIIIAGRGEDLEKYIRMIHDPDKYEIINRYIENEEVADIFQRASVVVLPYTDASQSAVIPLAYSFQKPVVASSVGCLPDVVDDGVTGMLVPAKNPQKIADAVISLLKDDNKRVEMGKKGQFKAINELSWDKIGKETIGFYKEITKKV